MTETAEHVTYADVEAARERIAEHVRRTPMLHKAELSKRFGVPMYLKGEHLQRTGSFKLRGATNLIAQLSPAERTAGVVAASAGNHAQGVAVAATAHGVNARIFMPSDATLSKVEATRHYGAQVELVDADFEGVLQAAKIFCAEQGATFVHPFDDPRIVAGQGTLGLEILEDLPDVGTILIPIGGGGLFAGIATAIRHHRPNCRLVGVQSAGNSSIAPSLAAGRPVAVAAQQTMADGIAVKQPGGLPFSIIQDTIDDVVVVDDEAISQAILWCVERAKQVVEGSAATTIAALHSREARLVGPTVCLLSGGNIDSTLLMSVIRHGLTAAERYIGISTTLPDKPGELAGLLGVLAVQRANILAIEHQREGVDMPVGTTRIELSLQVRNVEHAATLMSALRDAGYVVSRS